MPLHPDPMFDEPEMVVCWHAATCNEKVFKGKYNSFKIKKMNVALICDKILKMMTQPPGRETHNLYLCTQLMFGVTKIYRYQTEYYEKEVFELEKKMHIPSPEPLIREYEEPLEIQLLVSEDSPRVLSDIHILQDEDYDYATGRMIRRPQINLDAWQDFGVLSNEQLIFFLDCINGKIPLDRTEERERIMGEVKDVSDMMAADVVIAEEIHREKHQSQEIRSPEFRSRLKERSKTESTPQKRQSQTPVETPTKRKRLTFEHKAAVDPSEEVPTKLSMEVELPPIPAPEKETAIQQSDSNMELEPLDTTVFAQHKTSKRKQKVFDRTNTLRDEKWLYTQWRENPNIHCEEIKMPTCHLTSSVKLLRQPATEIRTRWGRGLRRLFTEHATPCAFPSKDEEDTVPPVLMQSQQAVRAEQTTSILGIEKSSVLGKTQAGITADSLAGLSVSNIPPIHPIDLNVPREIIEPEVPLDMITSIENISIVGDKQDQAIKANVESETSLEDIDKLLQRRSPSKAKTNGSLLSSSEPSRSQPSLTIHEILAMLQVLWQERSHVTLNDLVPENTYSTDDIVVAFEILLVLHSQRKVVLLQSFCYDTLYIRDPKA